MLWVLQNVVTRVKALMIKIKVEECINYLLILFSSLFSLIIFLSTKSKKMDLMKIAHHLRVVKNKLNVICLNNNSG